MNITKENIIIMDYTEVWPENSSLLQRPLRFRILVTAAGHELLSIQTFGLDDVIKARDALIEEGL